MNDLAKQQVLALLAEAETKQAIALLQQLARQSADAKIQSHVVQLSGRFERLEKDRQKGIVSFENAQLASNQMTADLTALTEAWSRGEVPPAPELPAAPGKKSAWLKIGAALAGVAVVAFVAIKLSEEPLQLTVYVHGSGGKSDIVLENAGELVVTFSDDRRALKVGEKGRTNFGEIPGEMKGEEIQIGLTSKDFELAHPKEKLILTRAPIYLEVKRKTSLMTISGVVKNQDGSRPIPGATVIINSDTTVMTNALGKFFIVLPDRMYSPVYQLQITKEGYSSESEEYDQGVGTTQIRLSR